MNNSIVENLLDSFESTKRCNLSREARALPYKDSCAVVTGASSGIGRAIAIEFAGLGAEHLVVHYHTNRRGAEETAEQCKALGTKVSLFPCDLAQPVELDRFVTEVFDEIRVVNTWVNNAGADVLTGSLAAKSFDEKIEKLMDVDVLGTIRISRLVAKRMSSQITERPASIAFVGWDQADSGMEGDAGQMFGPVKSAITSFAKSLAQSVAPKIRVNTVAPGWIQTSWGETTSGYWDERAKGQSLMGRWGTPEDVAKAMAFVCDPANTFCTGQVVNVNGGWNPLGGFDRAIREH